MSQQIFQFNSIAYGLTQAGISIFPAPIVANRAPTGNDKKPIGSTWVNETNNFYYVLTSFSAGQAVWQVIAQGSGSLDQLTTDAGVALPTAGNININGGGSTNIHTSASGSTITVAVISSPSFAGTTTVATGLVATTGNIVATAGQVNAGTTMTAGTGLTVSSFTVGVVQSNNAGQFSSSTGTNGQVLIGGGSAPVWANITAGANITVTNAANSITIASGAGAQTVNYVSTSTTPYVALATDYYISVDSSGGAKTVQLPDAPSTGRIFTVKDKTGSAATHNITVTTVGGVVTIDGATTNVLTVNFESAQYLFNGTSYEVF